MTTWPEEIYHAAAMLDFDAPLTSKEAQLLRAAQYRIAVRLGDKPLPTNEHDIAANAYAVRTMNVA